MVRLVTQQELINLSNHLVLTRHARERIIDRHNRSIYNIRKEIVSSKLAWVNTDGNINVSINKYEYYVFDGFKLVTFMEKSHNNITARQKYLLAKSGVEYHYKK